MPQPGIEVLNEHPINFPSEVKIAVLNKNDKIFIRRWDGIEHEFPPQEAVIITTEAAFNIFAVDTRTAPGYPIKIRRDKHAGKTATNNSWYDEDRLAVGAVGPDGEAFFDNFDFKLVKSVKKLTAIDFDKIPVK